MKFGSDNISQENELGFELGDDQQTANMFQLFAQGQKGEGTNTPVTLTTTDTPPILKEKTDSKDTKTGEDKPEGDDNKESQVDTNKLRELIEKDLKGEKESSSVVTKEGEDNKETDHNKPASTLSVVYDDFKENGIIEVPEDFEFDGSEESLKEAVQLTVEARLADAVDQTIEEAFQKNPQNAAIAKEYIKYLGMGGNPATFVANHQDLAINDKDFDSEDEAIRVQAAKTTLTNYYRDILKWPEDRIKRQIERSEAKGEDILVDEARDYFEEYQATMKKRREEDMASVQAADNKRKQDVLEFNTKLSTAIDTAEEVGGFKFSSKKEREAFKDYLFKPTVEVNGKKVPQYLADRLRLQNTPDFIMAQAAWLKNGMKPDTKLVTTKVTSSLEQKLSDLQKGKKVSSASGQSTDSTNRSTPGLLDFDGDMEVINL